MITGFMITVLFIARLGATSFLVYCPGDCKYAGRAAGMGSVCLLIEQCQYLPYHFTFNGQVLPWVWHWYPEHG